MVSDVKKAKFTISRSIRIHAAFAATDKTRERNWTILLLASFQCLVRRFRKEHHFIERKLTPAEITSTTVIGRTVLLFRRLGEKTPEFFSRYWLHLFNCPGFIWLLYSRFWHAIVISTVKSRLAVIQTKMAKSPFQRLN